MMMETTPLSLLGAQMLAHPLAVSADWAFGQKPENDPNNTQLPGELDSFTVQLEREGVPEEKLTTLKKLAGVFEDRKSCFIMFTPFQAKPMDKFTLKLGEELRQIPNRPYQRAISNMLAGGRYSFPDEGQRHGRFFGPDLRPMHTRGAMDITSLGVSLYLLALLLPESPLLPFFYRSIGDALTIAGAEGRAHMFYRQTASLWMAEARGIFGSETENPQSIHWMNECLRRAKDMLARVGESSIVSVELGA